MKTSVTKIRQEALNKWEKNDGKRVIDIDIARALHGTAFLFSTPRFLQEKNMKS